MLAAEPPTPTVAYAPHNAWGWVGGEPAHRSFGAAVGGIALVVVAVTNPLSIWLTADQMARARR